VVALDPSEILSKHGEKAGSAVEASAKGKHREAFATAAEIAGQVVGVPGLGSVARMLQWSPVDDKLSIQVEKHQDREQLLLHFEPTLVALQDAGVAKITSAFEEALGTVVEQLGRTNRDIPGETVEQLRRMLPQFLEELPTAVASAAHRLGARLDVPAQSRSPVYNLPTRGARQIIGREADLERVMHLLEPRGDARIAASIEGLAGVGKTELALHAVQRLAAENRFPGGVFWLEAEKPDLAAIWGGPIAARMGLTPGIGTLQDRSVEVLRRIETGPPSLVVLDNVETWTTASCPNPLPEGSAVARLVTTRTGFLGGQEFAHHTLECLPPAAGRALLLTIADRDLGPMEDVDALVEHLGGHALAIELAGAYLHESPDVSAREYLSVRTPASDADKEVSHLVSYEKTLWECFHCAWTRLSPSARHGALVASHFPLDDALLSFLEDCGVRSDERRELRRFHLITSNKGRWRMHRLVREHIRSECSDQEVEASWQQVLEGLSKSQDLVVRGLDELSGSDLDGSKDGVSLDTATAFESTKSHLIHLSDMQQSLSRVLDEMHVLAMSAIRSIKEDPASF
jgi:hypothetical protein